MSQQLSQQPPLTNLPPELVSRRNIYLQIAMAETDEESKINLSQLVNALFSIYKCGDACSPDKEIAIRVMKQIINLIGKWRFNLGAMTDVSENQMRQEASFIVENYPYLKVEELSLVIRLVTTSKLNAVYYGSFNPKYIAEAITAYQSYSQNQQRLLVSKRQPMEVKTTPKQEADAMRYMIIEVDNQLRANKPYVFMINDVFNYLRRKNKIVLDDTMMEDAKKYADQKIASLQKAKNNAEFKSMKSVLEPGYSKDNKNNLHINFTNEYCVKLFFTKNDVIKLAQGVNEKDFS